MKYRKLINEPVQAGDVFCLVDANTPAAYLSPASPGNIGENSSKWDNNNGQWYRLAQDNWIAFSDRKPTKEDADKSGMIVVRSKCGGVYIRNINTIGEGREWEPTIQSYWMPLNFVPREPTRIEVDGHEVVPNKDGSLKVGCQTVSSQDFEEIVRQRSEAMK